ncbi:hypothetical protein FKP32DRAFT_1550217, partial [Trametes sanguinea]
MGIDGGTCGHTYLDDESGGIVLRRLHPRIASYNDLVIFLMKSNMDIKFIGSGEAAKALLYYVTDYITKPSLPTHVGLSALSYAVQKTNEKFAHLQDSDPKKSRGALTVTVNKMLSSQEISHQQVMSYLVGGGDVYSSHTYRVLHWGSFDRMFKKAFPSDSEQSSVVQPVSQDETHEESFVLSLDNGSVTASNQQQDYVYRSVDTVFDTMCLYEFVGMTEKESIKSELVDEPDLMDLSGIRSTADPVATESESSNVGDGNSRGLPRDARRRGRTAAARGLFSSTAHSQHATHKLRHRTEWKIPVLLGERIPRSDRSEDERESWARMMLILFVPWRIPQDLRSPAESWATAFERQRDRILPRHLTIMQNMNVLSECRDVRDAFREMRRAEALAQIRAGVGGNGNEHTGRTDGELENEFDLFDSGADLDAYSKVYELEASGAALDGAVGVRARQILDDCYGSGMGQVDHGRLSGSSHPPSRARTEEDEVALLQHASIMRSLKRQRVPQFRSPDVDEEDARPRKRRRRAVVENVSKATLSEASSSDAVNGQPTAHDIVRDSIEQVIQEMNLRDNAEQERAFRVVADHVLNPDRQLFLYVAGVGGTGKTWVVSAILRLFELLDR